MKRCNDCGSRYWLRWFKPSRDEYGYNVCRMLFEQPGSKYSLVPYLVQRANGSTNVDMDLECWIGDVFDLGYIPPTSEFYHIILLLYKDYKSYGNSISYGDRIYRIYEYIQAFMDIDALYY